ncbi:rano class II histocompatibility antigen, A beta chain-like isoform X2 [Garra rufa]|uniref:rano class II histocompatibility antigen, A beta chain-like isoform X2 n=1 Tax=Garra rufa TaxID=137080 RepID=UPI003CCEA95A
MSFLKLLIFHPILMLSAFTSTADGYYFYNIPECVYSTSDYSDMLLLWSFSFNKVVDLQYNSSVEKFVGYTEQGVKFAENANKDQALLQQLKAEVDRFCRHNAQNHDSSVRDKAEIKVSWLRDGKLMTSEVTSTMELADGDWYYQIHSELEYTPKSGEQISCMVQHASSPKPIITHWDPSLLEPGRNKIAIGASGLVLGIIIAAAGLIYYKKKSAGRILVPN